jgi:hypothetical protein
VIGIQCPIVAYHFGQHVAAHLFIWRCRQETRKDERRNYGIRLPQDDDSLGSAPALEQEDVTSPTSTNATEEDSQIPSVRAIATALFILSVVTADFVVVFYGSNPTSSGSGSLVFSVGCLDTMENISLQSTCS